MLELSTTQQNELTNDFVISVTWQNLLISPSASAKWIVWPALQGFDATIINVARCVRCALRLFEMRTRVTEERDDVYVKFYIPDYRINGPAIWKHDMIPRFPLSSSKISDGSVLPNLILSISHTALWILINCQFQNSVFHHKLTIKSKFRCWNLKLLLLAALTSISSYYFTLKTSERSLRAFSRNDVLFSTKIKCPSLLPKTLFPPTLLPSQ